MSARISVVVPSYNHALFVERCLHSIFRQTRPPDQLLVIDDGSTDASPEIIERALADCPFPAEFIRCRNRGLTTTLNDALARTEGEYFAYLGSDDLWMPTFLAERSRILESRPNAVLACGHGYIIDENETIYNCSSEWKHFRGIIDDARPLLSFGHAPVNPTVFYRRSVLERYGWNEEAKLEDYELYLQLAEEGEFAFDPSVLAAWRGHRRNTSRDLEFMVSECLAAQQRAAKKLGWSDDKLADIETRTRFFHAIGFDQHGYKRRAFSLYFRNLRGAPDLATLLKSFLRLITPSFILRLRHRSERERSMRKYGKIKI
jgi:alpha-1,3-rhamnosyltransferase